MSTEKIEQPQPQQEPSAEAQHPAHLATAALFMDVLLAMKKAQAVFDNDPLTQTLPASAVVGSMYCAAISGMYQWLDQYGPVPPDHKYPTWALWLLKASATVANDIERVTLMAADAAVKKAQETADAQAEAKDAPVQ